MTPAGVMRTPRHVDIDITGRCNLRCSYCYHFSSRGDVPADLPTGEWLSFFDELGDNRVMDVTLAGGEPFLRPDLAALLEGIVANRMRFSILSNGTLIDDDTAAMLASTGRCNAVQVSIDGSCAAVHETCRGAGTFGPAVAAVSRLREHGVPVAVRLTVHRRNIDDLEAAARFLLEDLGLLSFSTNAAAGLGLARGHADGVSLTVEDRTRAMATLAGLAERYGGRITAQAGPLAEARMWGEMLRGGGDGGVLSSCGGVWSALAVRADGVYVPCTLLPMIELGRINRDPLEGVWRRHPELARLRERSGISLEAFFGCRGCPFLAGCRGGCPGVAAAATDSAFEPCAETCLRRFLAAGGRVPGA